MKSYAGIGSRETPSNVSNLLTQFAHHMANKAILRTGAARGADQAFMKGCYDGSGHAKIYLPWPGYELGSWVNGHTSGLFGCFALIPPEAYEMAASNHPAWDRCSRAVRNLHARNELIVHGISLDNPVDVVIAWTPDGKASGGTGQAIRSAQKANIPVVILTGSTENMIDQFRAAKRILVEEQQPCTV